jgi:uncharacterized protein (TIGR02679 family)
MNSSTDARLQRLLGGDALASLRRRLRRRFERSPLDVAVKSIRIGTLSVEEHAALASLLGRPQRYTSSFQVDVRMVDVAFRNAGIATSLRDALERLDGPIDHLATTRLRLQTLWSDVIVGCRHAGLAGLLRAPSGAGLLKRLAKQSPEAAILLCHRAETVLERLPANGVTRSQLAADALGDAHALDSGQPTATLVLAVWRQMAPQTRDRNGVDGEPTDDGEADPGNGTERDRDIWARAGVLVNELARPALFLNLPTHQAGSYRPAGEPAYASLRSLLRSSPAWDVSDRKVYVCENPNLLAIAADHWGSGCAPLVCTDGMPGAAQRCLLSQLAGAGAKLRYHGDFDWPGLRIGNHVMREHGAQPWRFGADDYAAAIRSASGLGQALTGQAVDAMWDKELAKVMQQRRISIAEEAVAALLLPDLSKW